MSLDLVVRRAQLRQCPDLVDIGVNAGRIVAVEPHLEADALEEVDAEGHLVLPGFVDSQFHAGKSFYGRETHRYDYREPEWDPANLEERYAGQHHSSLADYDASNKHIVPILKQWAWKDAYTVESVTERIVEALLMGLANGIIAVRLFMDVDNLTGLAEVEAALRAKARLSDLMQVQVCAFAQEGLVVDAGNAALMTQAMELGADVVGGHPWVEWTDESCQQHADMCFRLAERFGTPVHFLCDDVRSPMARTLEYVAARTLEIGWHGRVSSSHNGALVSYPDAHAQRVMNLVRNAQINMVCNGHVNLLGGLTRVHELVDLGVNVSMGQDDLDNFYYPFGRMDPLEWSLFMAHNGRFSYPEGVEQVIDMITVNGARTLGLTDYGIDVGCRADLVVLDCLHPREAIQYRADRLHVISGGRRVAGTTHESWVERPA